MPQRLTTIIARCAMRVWPAEPDVGDVSLGEFFDQPRFRDASADLRRELMLASATHRYLYERESCFFTKYFPEFPTDSLQGKRLLDLGAFTGGRLLYWSERYGLAEAIGIDVKPVFAESGRLAAAEKGVAATFDTGFGEALPYKDNSIDVITSYDVLEHVRDVEQVLDECFRILKPGGTLLAVFPQFYQPLESHLGQVTRMPALHWVFSGRTLARARRQIECERGEQAAWYARLDGPLLDDWEKLPSLNGITVAKFRRILNRNHKWRVTYWSRRPIMTDGRRAREWKFRILSWFLVIPARLPLLEELFLGRICVALEKDSDPALTEPPESGSLIDVNKDRAGRSREFLTRPPDGDPPVVGVQPRSVWAGGTHDDEAEPTHPRAGRSQAPRGRPAAQRSQGLGRGAASSRSLRGTWNRWRNQYRA